MPPTPDPRLLALEEKIEKIYISVEKTRKYIWWAFVITVAAVILPIIGLLFAIPSFLSSYDSVKTLGF